ncbi:small acid-soluble spore protein SspI [Paenibacillus sp. MMS18-CY102]|nr:small acid-soluble spore protein SspI [Paenibacillus sp. MMS18-CY102]MWC31018.1 small acid-soluble spore protein SspI [Paenibacillus sp. MMS18-CY102]
MEECSLNTIDLRQAIITRVKDKSNEELTDIIQDSIGSDERALPGLGVLFEMIWQDSSSSDQSRMVNSLHQHLHTGDSAPESGLGHS